MFARSSTSMPPSTPAPRSARATLPYDFSSVMTPDDDNVENQYAQLDYANANVTPLKSLLPASVLSPVLRSTTTKQRKRTRELLPSDSPLLKSPAIYNIGLFTAIAQAEDEEYKTYSSPYSQVDSMATPDLGFFSPASSYATSCSSYASPSCFTSPPTSYETSSPFLESAFNDLCVQKDLNKLSYPSPLSGHALLPPFGLFGPNVVNDTHSITHEPDVSPTASEFSSTESLTSAATSTASAGLKLSLFLAPEGFHSPPTSDLSHFAGRPLSCSSAFFASMLSATQVSTVTDLKREIISKLGLNNMDVSNEEVGLYLADPSSPSLSSEGRFMENDQNLRTAYGLHENCEASLVAVICPKSQQH